VNIGSWTVRGSRQENGSGTTEGRVHHAHSEAAEAEETGEQQKLKLDDGSGLSSA
jgi:hypothetical protein